MINILENKIIVILGVIALFTILYSLVKQNIINRKFKQEYTELLNKKEHKVKSQWDI